jgi:hypothetical protein
MGSNKSYRIISNNKLSKNNNTKNKNDNKEINTYKSFYYKYFCYLSAKIIPENQDCDNEKTMKY